jgi:HSP20 family protein
MQNGTGWRDLGRVVDEAFGLRAGVDSGWAPAVDVTEDPKSYTLAIELPGVRAEDVTIEIDGRRLTVSGEKRRGADERTGQNYRFERRYGTFSRTFTIPETVAVEGIEATSRDGVLTLTLPKVEKAQPKKIDIKTT